MPGGQYDLSEKKISATYHRVMQYESGSQQVLDGHGDPIVGFQISGSGIFSGDQTITGSLFVSGSLKLQGNMSRNTKTITTDYDVLTSDDVILVNSISSFSASLYDATGNAGNTLVFKVVGNFPFTITPFTGQTLDGGNNLIITDKWSSVEIIATGSNWYII